MANGNGGCECDGANSFVSDGSGNCVCDADNNFVGDGSGGCECDGENGFVSDGYGGCVCDLPSGYVPDGSGGCIQRETILSPSDGGSNFGFSVSISEDGSRAIVGADSTANRQGHAYIFDFNGTTWEESAILADSSGVSGDGFGFSVSMSDDGSRVIVGAHGRNNSKGQAYIYDFSGASWEASTLMASDGQSDDEFGRSVSISGDGSRVIVGAPKSDDYTGKAYIYDFNGASWEQSVALTASDGGTYQYYGNSVSISGDGSRVIVGAFSADNDKGQVYIYDFNGASWEQSAALTRTDSAAYTNFGQFVSISNDGSWVIVGAPSFDQPASNTGEAYIYNLIGASWELSARLTGLYSDGYYGRSVSLNGDGSRAMVGAYEATVNGITRQGQAFLYDFNGTSWEETEILMPSDGGNFHKFGQSVSISADGSRAMVGAYGANSYLGQAYIYVV